MGGKVSRSGRKQVIPLAGIHAGIHQHFHNAGVLAFKVDPKTHKVWVLIGSQGRKWISWCSMGGKREDGEMKTEETALREWTEEVVKMGLFAGMEEEVTQQVRRGVNHGQLDLTANWVWYLHPFRENADYLLYLVDLSDGKPCDPTWKWVPANSEKSEKQAIRWVPLDDLLAVEKPAGPKTDAVLEYQGEKHALYPNFYFLLKNHRERVLRWVASIQEQAKAREKKEKASWWGKCCQFACGGATKVGAL